MPRQVSHGDSETKAAHGISAAKAIIRNNYRTQRPSDGKLHLTSDVLQIHIDWTLLGLQFGHRNLRRGLQGHFWKTVSPKKKSLGMPIIQAKKKRKKEKWRDWWSQQRAGTSKPQAIICFGNCCPESSLITSWLHVAKKRQNRKVQFLVSVKIGVLSI